REQWIFCFSHNFSLASDDAVRACHVVLVVCGRWWTRRTIRRKRRRLWRIRRRRRLVRWRRRLFRRRRLGRLVMKHPRWCLQFISPVEIHNVTNAVKAAEKNTDGEIVPVIVRQSARTGLLPQLLFVIGCLIAAAFYIGAEIHGWAAEPVWIAF